MLRDSLIAPSPDKELVDKLERLANIATDVFWPDPHSTDPEALQAVEDIQAITGMPDYDAFYFHSLPGWSSTEAFANRAALGDPSSSPDLTKSEIVDVLKRIAEANDDVYSDYYLRLLERSFPYADITDVIYWPDRERTSEEVAEEILHRKSLFEAGGSGAVKAHIWSLAQAVLENADTPVWARKWAEGYLKDCLDGSPN
ncbi:hypothetical protein [Hyphomonas sp.]|uniref:hypothetical protein n=1 Tax=Hyphomonas sp. TaxID=87 RepID=UPI0035270FE6